MRLELRAGTSHKFWDITRTAKVLRIRWGRIGTAGQEQEKRFASPEAAAREHDKLLAAKQKKGYRVPTSNPTKPSKPAKAAKAASSRRVTLRSMRGGQAAASPPAGTRCVHVGRVLYNAHPASPLVIGDFTVMKAWKGDPAGRSTGTVKLETGTVVTLDPDLVAPDVFVVGDEVVLLAEADHNKSLLTKYSLDDLRPDLVGRWTKVRSWKLRIASGAVVVSITYNATPEEGADTSALDPLTFCAGDRPLLPRRVPTRPLWTDKRSQRDLAVIPLTPGTYAIERGSTPRFFRCTIRRVGP